MNHLRCDFCFFNCEIEEGKTGHCAIRRNQSGQLISETWGQSVALAADPIEKKPFFHVQPGAMTLSVALFGCNFTCKFCQNATISQAENKARHASGIHLGPEALADRMVELGLDSVSFTYSEPTVWQDWMVEAARAVKASEGHCFMVTNGSFSSAARQRFSGLIDAYNIDVKGDDRFYREYCGGRLEPVMDNVRALSQLPDVAVEVCTLLIEGIHHQAGIISMGQQLAQAGVQVWHLSRFFPAWKMQNQAPTSEAWLEDILGIVRREVDIPWIYGGNTSQVMDTICPRCQTVLIERHHGRQGQLQTVGGQCPTCGRAFELMAW